MNKEITGSRRLICQQFIYLISTGSRHTLTIFIGYRTTRNSHFQGSSFCKIFRSHHPRGLIARLIDISVVHLETIYITKRRPQIVIGVTSITTFHSLQAPCVSVMSQVWTILGLEGVPKILTYTSNEAVAGICLQTSIECIGHIHLYYTSDKFCIRHHFGDFQSLILIVQCCIILPCVIIFIFSTFNNDRNRRLHMSSIVCTSISYIIVIVCTFRKICCIRFHCRDICRRLLVCSRCSGFRLNVIYIVEIYTVWSCKLTWNIQFITNTYLTGIYTIYLTHVSMTQLIFVASNSINLRCQISLGSAKNFFCTKSWTWIAFCSFTIRNIYIGRTFSSCISYYQMVYQLMRRERKDDEIIGITS